jgi:hypothetical protein
MKNTNYDFRHIKTEVREITHRHPALKPDEGFLTWFLRAFIVDDEDTARKSLTGKSRDKGIDGIYLDHDARTVFVLQGKYRQADSPPLEDRNHVLGFAHLAGVLKGVRADFAQFIANLDEGVLGELEKARKMMLAPHNYRLSLYFVTSGRVSKNLAEEAEATAAKFDSTLQVFDRHGLVRLLHDYVEGAAPPVPALDLPTLGTELLHRHDPATRITSYLFSMSGKELAKIYDKAGIRLFARNIRGYLGKSLVNREMQSTLKSEPEYFWYFNNGVTIICDSAKHIQQGGASYLHVENAQIVNGQQTTRTLSQHPTAAAAVLVKLISVPRSTEMGQAHYERLVGEIVAATNWQNRISLSDLRSNDVVQVHLERELRKLDYQYIRKQMSKGEAHRVFGRRHRWFVKKEDLARSVGGCLFDPYQMRLGKERLFEEENYKEIFNGRSASEFLVFYWLHKIVAKESRSDSRRGYARWVVLNFVWSELGPLLLKPLYGNRFRMMAEAQSSHERDLQPLRSGIDRLYLAALAFYRKNKRSLEKKRKDESTFFKQAKLREKFLKFWNSQANTVRRRAVSALLKRFQENLIAYEA